MTGTQPIIRKSSDGMSPPARSIDGHKSITKDGPKHTCRQLDKSEELWTDSLQHETDDDQKYAQGNKSSGVTAAIGNHNESPMGFMAGFRDLPLQLQTLLAPLLEDEKLQDNFEQQYNELRLSADRRQIGALDLLHAMGSVEGSEENQN